jgi:CRP-like cAMP-binding protein
MKKYLGILRKCSLFGGIEDENLIQMLGCLGAKTETYRKNETVFSEGDSVETFGIVLSGEVQIVQNDYYGNRSILANIEASELFGETYACAEIDSLPVAVVASEDSEVMMLDVHHVTRACGNACSFHSQIIFNLVKIVAEKNLVFHRKIMVTSGRTTRDKLMAYLLSEAKRQNSDTFKIPYDRQELADYLEVERSGLSTEIGKLRREGVILADKNAFTILQAR